MTHTGYAGYRKVMVETVQKKEEILLLLYEEAIAALNMARRGILENKPRLKGEKVSRALKILTELECALDRDKGAELAENLAALYRYSIHRVTIANIHNDPDALQEAEKLLSELYEGFKFAARQKPLVLDRNSHAGSMERTTIAVSAP
ncbi:flagellar export chaperone FliS [Desulfoglaeba alkanexedens]|uniref:Flagellar secretion chaperone FliS n=1 Tax=Desulfoglaeba alkanexedens ALDC TaxID=980445 RepID=A0A4P8L1D5_9BACT|nr:flagellar export chaperone FliS [Desulfoglaeba alkanexedens]QCQ21648.1 flagellar export chaperone FliS [Desulfoglaeba alkanexedens ALDC]